MARYSPAASTTGRASTTMLVFSRWTAVVADVVPALDPLQAAASSATARLPAAARDTRPARVNLMVLLQVTGESNRRLQIKQDIYMRAGVYRISAAGDRYGIPVSAFRPRPSAPRPRSVRVPSPLRSSSPQVRGVGGGAPRASAFRPRSVRVPSAFRPRSVRAGLGLFPPVWVVSAVPAGCGRACRYGRGHRVAPCASRPGFPLPAAGRLRVRPPVREHRLCLFP